MNSLVVFARAPVAGETKTRLALAIGDEAAAAVAAAMLRDTLETARRWSQGGGAVSVAYSPTGAFDLGVASLANFWDGSRFPQDAGDIGARMLDAIRHERWRGSHRVVIIGSDAPEMGVEILNEAFRSLEVDDLSFGPAHDGGFHYFGSRLAVPPKLFANMQWSTPDVLTQTLAGARQLGLTYALGPPLHDIDELQDLVALRERMTHTDVAPHTRAALTELQPFFERLE